MKTSREIADEIFEELNKSYIRLDPSISKDKCNLILETFEQSTRQDQDKITRHACAESVAKGVQRRIGGFTASQKFYDKAHQAIMNTKAL